MRVAYPLFILCCLLLAACGRDQVRDTDTVATSIDVPVPVGKLGDAVQPVAYRLDLTILPEQTDFSGSTEIDVNIVAATTVIYLHGNGLKVSAASLVTPSGDIYAAEYTQVDSTGVARLKFAKPVPAGSATLQFEYVAPFKTRSEGLYHTTVAGMSYAFTQFQPIDARRVFPGFDEPAFKTPFTISVTAKSQNVVISNAPVMSEELTGDGNKRVVFEATEPLPTYLIAFAVGPLDVVEGVPLPSNSVRDRTLPFRAAATSGKGERLRFVLDNTDPIVTYLEEYFAVEYPYPKLDLIASPEFGTGAMENAGAIIYGDALVLLNDNAAPEQRQRLGSTHAHELAHHWFGDLVTPKWWDDVWLNESFATWMGNKAAHAWRPEYQLDMVSLERALAAMNLDSRIAARQIRQPVENNLDIASSFDSITYRKGGGVLSMFESYLGEEGFRNGLRTHMRRFAYSVADVEDFMSSLAEGSGRPDVVSAFRSFIDQPGVPIVDVALTCSDETASITLHQSRYLPVGSKGNSAQTWQLPFCVRYGSGQEIYKECMLLTGVDTAMPLESTACPEFIMPNANGAGYYRFALDEAGWRSLMAGFDRLNEKEALVVADSLSAAYQANRISTATLIVAFRTVAASPYAQVAMAPGKDLVRMSNTLASSDARAGVLELMRDLYRPRLAALGSISETPTDTAAVQQALFRTRLVDLLALDAEDPVLRADLAEQAGRYIRLGEKDASGIDETAVDPALVNTALAVGVQELGAPFVDTLIDRLVASSDAKFRTDAAVALGATDDAVLGERVRDLLSGDQLRSREPTKLAFALAGRPSQRRATFDWFRENESTFTAGMSHFARRWLPRMGIGFCTLRERDEVSEFFAPLVINWQGAERTLAEVLEGIELCAALHNAKSAEVDKYFSGG
jgi:cytosol alanyl aminopeptidase